MTTPAEYRHIAEALLTAHNMAKEAELRASAAGDEKLRREIAGHVFDIRTTLDGVREKAERR